jgi:hypothetical protein
VLVNFFMVEALHFHVTLSEQTEQRSLRPKFFPAMKSVVTDSDHTMMMELAALGTQSLAHRCGLLLLSDARVAAGSTFHRIAKYSQLPNRMPSTLETAPNPSSL